MLVSRVCLACDANLAGLSLLGLELRQVTRPWDASPTATELLEPGTLVSNLNILCSDVIDQKREMGWHKAGRQPWEADGGCQCQVSSPGAPALSQQDCAVPGQSSAMPCLGLLDVVVLQINNRV